MINYIYICVYISTVGLNCLDDDVKHTLLSSECLRLTAADSGQTSHDSTNRLLEGMRLLPYRVNPSNYSPNNLNHPTML